MGKKCDEDYGEFKGSTKARLVAMHEDIKSLESKTNDIEKEVANLRADIKGLRGQWIGFGAAGGAAIQAIMWLISLFKGG